MKKTALIVFLIGILASCDNEIEINAPWVETPVVYGLLDPNSSIQYIRIEKTYQNSVNQTTQQGAQYPDSLYFDTLDVRVYGSGGNEYKFVKTPVEKKPGTFTNAEAYIYKCENFVPDPTQYYNLSVFSPKSGKMYTSRTTIVGKSNLLALNNTYQIRIYPHQSFNRFIYYYEKGTNAVSYDLYIRMRYLEYPIANPAQITYKQLDYPLGLNQTGSQINGTPNKLYLQTGILLNFFKKALTNNTAVERKFIAFDYVAIGGSVDLKVMVDLSQPTKSFVQNKPEYSNITGGLGIFSSRSVEAYMNIPFMIPDDSSKYYLRNALPRFVP